MTELGFAVRVGMPEEVVRSAAERAERAGYTTLWVNNPPGQDGLTPVSWAADATSRIRVGTAVVPVSNHSPEEIRERATSLGLTRDRYRLGIGSGSSPHPRRAVRDAVRELRPAGYELVVAALGPGMWRLVGEVADGGFHLATTPQFARRSAELAREAAAAAGRQAPRVYVGVLAGMGPDARPRLEASMAFLAQLPQYVAHFQRMGVAPNDTLLAAADEEDLARQLAPWHGTADEVVISAVPPPDRPEAVLDLIEPVRAAWEGSAGRAA
jgi:alkanesulfonate monooxygenase SsuD/methylene tetrahydromethanopterin reductase-like flavin-dependent oxidoreductase (luciferase family)